jgi:branched-chain amino acid transport system ATP-binding protein
LEALKIDNLAKAFGGIQAVDHISFSVQVGERLGIIGPNGAGKTTLFNLLNGQYYPTDGHIYFFGKEIAKYSTNRRAHLGISRSFQISRLFFRLTILENCLLALQGTTPSRYRMFSPVIGQKQLLTKAEKLLSSVALWEIRDELVKNMSYGDQRRLEIVLSLALEPKILLLDEPTAGLTGAEGTSIIEMINNLGKNITVLLIAHDMDLMFGVAERIIVLHYGKIIAAGTPKEMRVNSKVKEIYMGLQEGK